MIKPRVVIADTDINYIVPFQLKFMTDFFEKINLEVITDRDYFNELFTTPQKIDVLIVSDDLYTDSIKKHDINYMFLMMEQLVDEPTIDMNVKRIFKYTSIKEIFNEIVSQSVGVFSDSNEEEKGTQLIVVTSACGGAGKTTVAMGISGCLTNSHKKVLYINASSLHMFQAMLENSSPISEQDVYSRLIRPSKEIYQSIKHVIRYEHFNYLPPFKAALMSLGIDESVYREIIESAVESGDYDFVVADTDSIFNNETASLLDMADKVLIVTEQDKLSVLSTNVLVSNINGISPEKYIFVCNKYKKDSYNALVAPDVTPGFSVNEYIEAYDTYDMVSNAELSERPGIKKTAFLML